MLCRVQSKGKRPNGAYRPCWESLSAAAPHNDSISGHRDPPARLVRFANGPPLGATDRKVKGPKVQLADLGSAMMLLWKCSE